MSRGFRSDDRNSDPGHTVGEVTVITKSDRAILIRMPDNDEEWIPISQIHADSEINEDSERDTDGALIITSWLASKKDWA